LRAAVVTTIRLEATVRPSLALYNTKDEIDRLVDAVKRILRADKDGRS